MFIAAIRYPKTDNADPVPCPYYRAHPVRHGSPLVPPNCFGGGGLLHVHALIHSQARTGEGKGAASSPAAAASLNAAGAPGQLISVQDITSKEGFLGAFEQYRKAKAPRKVFQVPVILIRRAVYPDVDFRITSCEIRESYSGVDSRSTAQSDRPPTAWYVVLVLQNETGVIR